MGAVTTAWGARLEEVLADGEWHDREAVLQALIPLVPPGVAYRAAEYDRERRRDTAPDERILGNNGAAVLAGQRTVARRALNDRVRQGTVERDGQLVRRRRS